MEIGKQYDVRILKRKGISLQKHIVFIGECFNIDTNYVEFIDVRTQNVRLVDNHSDKSNIKIKG